MLPHQEFFYTFQDLPATASPVDIRRACPAGFRRQFAFKHFSSLHPDDVRYLEGYLAAYVRNGVYDDLQFSHCFHLIDKGMELADRVGCHAKLRALRADLERQQAEMIEQLGAEPPVDKKTYSTYRALLHAPQAESGGLVDLATRLFQKRTNDRFFSAGEQTEGGGPDNAITADYRSVAVLKKIRYADENPHRWHWS